MNYGFDDYDNREKILDIIDDFLDLYEAVEFNKREEESVMKQYSVTYYEDGVRKSRIIEAENIEEAYQIAWSLFDDDDMYISEV